MSGTAAASLPRRRNTREVEAFLVRMHRQGGREAKSNSTGLRAFATGGPVVGRPRCSRTFLTEARSVRKASTVMRPREFLGILEEAGRGIGFALKSSMKEQRTLPQ